MGMAVDFPVMVTDEELRLIGEPIDPVDGIPRESTRIRVLLADDHKLLRQSLARMLREHPDIDVVCEASDGEMAVDMALKNIPDVVVIDVSMPRLDGVEATRRIMANLSHVRVIGLSMYEAEDMGDAIMEAGAIAYLRKDGPFDLLVNAVRGQLPAQEDAPHIGRPR